MIVELAVDVALKEKVCLQSTPISLMCDKGEGHTRRAGGLKFSKLVAKYNREKGRVRVIYIGIESVDGTSSLAAKALDHNLVKYNDPTKVKINYTGTDTGGGSTRDNWQRTLHKIDCVANIDLTLATTCSLHAMSLMIASLLTLALILADYKIALPSSFFIPHGIFSISTGMMRGKACGSPALELHG